MRCLQQTIFMMLAVFAFTACSKKSDNQPAPPANEPIQGVWAGKFGTGNGSPTSFFSYHFKAGGVLEELTDNGQVKGTGTWKLDNNIITGYTVNVLAPAGKKYSMVGAFNASQAKINGNWGYETSTTDGGLWEMSKKN